MSGFANLLGGGGRAKATLYFTIVPAQRWVQWNVGHPDGGYAFGQFNNDVAITASAQTRIDIYWGDGTRTSHTGINFNISGFKVYPTGEKRNIKMVFHSPELITHMWFGRGRIHGIFPTQLHRFPNLTVFSIKDNPVTAFPAQAFDMDKLTQFALSQTHITSLPDMFGKLADTLTHAYFDNNPIGTLPPSICLCTKLEVINVMRSGAGWFFTFPTEFYKLNKVKEIMLGQSGTIGANYGESMPLVVTKMPALEKIDFPRCYSFRNLNNIENIINLKYLHYGGEGFGAYFSGAVPAGFKFLIKLKTIIARGAYTAAELDRFIANIYSIVTAQASTTAGGNGDVWRNVSLDIRNSLWPGIFPKLIPSAESITKLNSLTTTYGWIITRDS